MRSSRPSVGALAAALAAAQSDLVNPEKTATGLLPLAKPGGEGRSFRYATLSTGLDVARRALSQREIALLQTTFVDREGGWLRLQSVLAHSSGEWVSSDWPVCPLVSALAPHRLGAAMTYARRYALFALIGIAGEDDLDAPDLDVASAVPSTVDVDPLVEEAASPSAARPDPPREAPETRSERLIVELQRIGSEEELWRWAYWRIAEKDALPRRLAAAVERSFAERVRDLEAQAPEGSSAPERAEPALDPADDASRTDRGDGGPSKGGLSSDTRPDEGADPNGAAAQDAQQPLLRLPPPRPVTPKTLRLRDKAHLEAIAHRPCLVCGRSPADPHHLRFAQPNALGRKSSDEFVVPLCRLHHDEVHKRGDERAWWRSLGVDPVPIALELWRAGQEPARSVDADR